MAHVAFIHCFILYCAILLKLNDDDDDDDVDDDDDDEDDDLDACIHAILEL